jgi:hypothetical protein
MLWVESLLCPNLVGSSLERYPARAFGLEDVLNCVTITLKGRVYRVLRKRGKSVLKPLH